MKRLALALLLITSPLVAQPGGGGIGGIAPNAFPVQTTVAALPAADGTQGVRVITDGASTSDCTVGGGSSIAVCVDTGAAWEVLAGGGGGSGDITAVGNCPTGPCFGATTATHAFMAPVGGGVAAFRAITDADIPDSITISLAATATTANSGDSATAFFSSGTIEHERGGLEANVSAFAGLVRIAAGSTTAVTNLAGLNTALGSSIADGAHTADTDNQGATEVAYTPTTGTDWTDPDPTEVGGALDDLAGRVTTDEAALSSHAGNASAHHTKTTDASELSSGTIPAARVGAAHVDAITEIASALKSGADTTLVTGTAGGSGICAEWNADGDLVAAASAAACGAGGSIPNKELVWPAAALLPLEHAADSIAPIVKEAGTNVDVLVRAFDDSTDECAGFAFQAPGDIDTSGTVTFAVYWYAATAAADDVIWDVRHTGRDSGETWDAALTTETAAAGTASASQDLVTETTWTETVSNLGWAADDFVTGELCRDADNGGGGDTLTGDAYLLSFKVKIPRA